MGCQWVHRLRVSVCMTKPGSSVRRNSHPYRRESSYIRDQTDEINERARQKDIIEGALMSVVNYVVRAREQNFGTCLTWLSAVIVHITGHTHR